MSSAVTVLVETVRADGVSSAAPPGGAHYDSSVADDTSASTSDWATQVVDTLEGVVGAIKSKTTEPALNVVRTIVYALMGVGLGFAALLLMTIGAVRMLDAYLPQGVWLAYLLIGGIFLIVGLLAWSKRTAKR